MLKEKLFKESHKGLSLEYFILAVILIGGAIVRYWAIDFGLPHTMCRPDEEFVVYMINSPLRNFHPGCFNYPSFYKYFVLCFYLLDFLLYLFLGKCKTLNDFIIDSWANPRNLYLINRYISAFLGVATILVVYKVAQKLFDKKTALLSALFLSLSYLHVRDSHFGTVDVPQAFLIMLSMLFIIKSYQDKTAKNYIIAGVFAGLATSTKYAGVFLYIPMLIMHFANIMESKACKSALFFDKRIVLFTGMFFLTFLLGTPFALLDFSQFKRDILFEMNHLKVGHGGLILGRGWWYHLRFSLPFGLGYNLFLASLAGILILIKTDFKKAMILCSFPLTYYLFAGKGYTVFLRYMIPVIPFLCITAAVFTVSIVNKLKEHFCHDLHGAIIFLSVFLIMVPSLYNIVLFDTVLAKKDNRLIAEEWVNKNIEKDNPIGWIGSIFGKIRVYPKDKFKKLESGKDKDILPKYVVVEESPLKIYSIISNEQKELLQKSYRLCKLFKAINVNNKANWFDQDDAFYIPFIGFKDIERPGPNIYVYERIY